MRGVHGRVTFAAPLEVSYLNGDGLQIITGQVEFSQGEDLTHTFGENTQPVVRQVQALQLGKPTQMETEREPESTKSASSGLNPQSTSVLPTRI